MSHVKQEQHTPPGHQSFSGIRVARLLVFCVMFSRSLSLFFWPLYRLSLFFWPLYCLSLFFCHCIVCPVFWPLHRLSCLLAIVSSVLLSFGHCIVCPSAYGFWLLLWYLPVCLTSCYTLVIILFFLFSNSKDLWYFILSCNRVILSTNKEVKYISVVF